MVNSGCGKLQCAISGDNVKGRVNFSPVVAPKTEGKVIIQYAADSNFTVVVGSTSKSNPHGIVTMPYSLCVTEGTDYFIRAFQDVDGNENYTSGEGSGRYDQNDTGNGSITAVNVPTSASGQNPNKKENIDISLDSLTGI